mmetsp:Transcript_28280/g.74623  ORF Transcript_28280/g.74623 Transcript_28280/m.74623 type:complete len:242 (-) Transcript_28280:384-1109(-)
MLLVELDTPRLRTRHRPSHLPLKGSPTRVRPHMLRSAPLFPIATTKFRSQEAMQQVLHSDDAVCVSSTSLPSQRPPHNLHKRILSQQYACLTVPCLPRDPPWVRTGASEQHLQPIWPASLSTPWRCRRSPRASPTDAKQCPMRYTPLVLPTSVGHVCNLTTHRCSLSARIDHGNTSSHRATYDMAHQGEAQAPPAFAPCVVPFAALHQGLRHKRSPSAPPQLQTPCLAAIRAHIQVASEHG